MTDSYVEIAPDSTGKFIDTAQLTVNATTVQRQRMVLGDNTTAANYAIVDSTGRLSTVAVDTSASGNITTQNLNPNSGAATAGSVVALTSLNGFGTVSIGVQGTYTGALTPQVSMDGTNWVALNLIVNVNTGTYSATITSASTGVWQADVAGCPNFRISANASVTGTAVVTLEASRGTGMSALDAPIPTGSNVIGALATGSNVIGSLSTGTNTIGALATGSNVIGALTANQSVNVAQVSAAAVSTSAAGVQQVGLGYVVSTAVVTSAAGVQQVGVGYIGTGAVSTAAAGVQKVGIVGNAGASLDAAVGTVPTNNYAAIHVPSTSSSAALSVKTLSAMSTATNVKASAGNLYGFSLVNGSTSAGFISFFNTSSTTTTGPVLSYPVAASATVYVPPGALAILNCATGIGIYCSTTVGGTTTITPFNGCVFYF